MAMQVGSSSSTLVVRDLDSVAAITVSCDYHPQQHCIAEDEEDEEEEEVDIVLVPFLLFLPHRSYCGVNNTACVCCNCNYKCRMPMNQLC